MRILKELLGDIDTEKEKRKKRAEKDFFFFAKTYFPHLFSVEPAEYQRIIIEIINRSRLDKRHIKGLEPYIHERYKTLLTPSERLEGIIDIEPRGHGKSTRMSILFPIWRVITGRSRFVVVFSSSEERGAQILDDIKFEITENEALTLDFGYLKGKIWKANFIHLTNSTAIASRGAGASVRGMRFRQFRPDLVICDDIMKDDVARSKTQREKLYQWFKKVVIPLGRDVFIVLVNTIFHHDDLPSRLLRESMDGKLKGWLALRFSAIINESPLWDKYWSMESLEKKRQEMGSLAFSTEYMNEPLSDEDRLFKEDWLTYDLEEVNTKEMKVLSGVDPALGSGDYSAIVTIAVDKEGIIHVIDGFAERITPDAFMDKIIQRYMRYKPQLIAFEDIAFQKVMKDYLIKKAAQYGIYLPVRGVSPGRLSKEMRISKLSPLVENRLIKFSENQRLLIEQLLTFPRGNHDDLLDALYYAVEIISGISREPMVFPLGVHRDAKTIFKGYGRVTPP